MPAADMGEMVDNVKTGAGAEHRGKLFALRVGDRCVVAAVNEEDRPTDRAQVLLLEIEAA